MLKSVIEKLVAEKGQTWATTVAEKVGVDSATAQKFVPIALQFIVSKFTESPEANISADDLDTDALAAESGLSKEQASAGLGALLPLATGALKGGDIDIAGMLSGKADAGDMMDMAKKGLGGLF